MEGFKIEEGRVNVVVFEDYQLFLGIRWPIDQAPIFLVHKANPTEMRLLVKKIRNGQVYGWVVDSTVVRFRDSPTWQNFCWMLHELGFGKAIGRAAAAVVELQKYESAIEAERSGGLCPLPIDFSVIDFDEERLDDEFPDGEDKLVEELPDELFVDVRKIVRQGRR